MADDIDEQISMDDYLNGMLNVKPVQLTIEEDKDKFLFKETDNSEKLSRSITNVFSKAN